MTDYPKIVAQEEENTGFLSFKCPWCHKTHCHGRGYGTRQSHCKKFDGVYELIPQEEECSA